MQSWQSAPVIGSAPAPRQQQQPSFGDPIVAPAPPSERRAEEDQALEREKVARQQAIEAERLQLSRQAEARAATDAERGGVEQGKAASFLKRAVNAETNFRKLGEVQPRSIPGQAIRETFPNVSNTFSDSSRQLAEQAEREFIAAILRYDSGAAIPPEEFVTSGQIYFPRPGDTPENLAQKAQARKVAIEGLLAASGPQGERAEVPDFDAMLKQGRDTAGGGDDDTPMSGFGNEAPQGYGDDGRGNPLVLSDGEVLVGYEDDIPLYGPFDRNSTVDPRAAALYRNIQDRERAMGAGGFGEVASAGGTLGLSDEAAGIGMAVGRLLQGDTNLGENFRLGQETEQFRTDQGRERLGAASIPIELLGAGGAIRSVGAFGQARQAVQSVRGAGRPVTRANVQGAMTRRAAVEGAGVGALAGAAQGDTLQERGQNALLGTVVGGITGGGVQVGGNALANRASGVGAAPRADIGQRARDLSGAANRTGFTRLNRAMVDPQSNNAVTKADATIVGGRVVQREMDAAADEFGERVGANLGAGGNTLDDVARGDTLKTASVRWIKETGEIANRRYSKAEQLAGDAKVEATSALAASDDILRRLRETPDTNSTEIAYVESVRRDLMGQNPDAPGLTVGALRRMRTALRKKISKGDLVFGEDEANVLAIMDNAANDIRTGLMAQGKGAAAKAFDSADKAYSARMQFIKNTVQKLVGPRQSNLNASQVARKVDSLSSSDYNEFRKVYAMLEPEERLDMAATLAQQLGRKTTETLEAPFSVDTFVTRTGKMDAPALRAVFGDDGARAVQDLRAIGKEIGRVRGSMNSRTSKSGVASYRDWMFSLLAGGGLGGVASGNLTGTAIVAGAAVGGNAVRQGLSARALMSPKITQWIRQAPRTSSPAAIDAHFGRLTAIAKSQPALAADIAVLQRQIMSAANDNAGRVAAEEDNSAQ